MWVCQGLATQRVMFSKWELEATLIHKVKAGGTRESMAWNNSPRQRGDSLLASPNYEIWGNHSWTSKEKEAMLPGWTSVVSQK